MILEGKVWRYGDNVDTDVIIPARYLNTADPKELAAHCMEDIDESFAKNVQPGDIIVADKNFGCGSSREHAPVAIKASGVPIVIADSFARMRLILDYRYWKLVRLLVNLKQAIKFVLMCQMEQWKI